MLILLSKQQKLTLRCTASPSFVQCYFRILKHQFCKRRFCPTFVAPSAARFEKTGRFLQKDRLNFWRKFKASDIFGCKRRENLLSQPEIQCAHMSALLNLWKGARAIDECLAVHLESLECQRRAVSQNRFGGG